METVNNMIAIKNILVPTDFGEAADAAFTYGRELTSRFGANLHVSHVADDLVLSPFAEAYGPMTDWDIPDGAGKIPGPRGGLPLSRGPA